ncbi:metal ABC transporter solute-binding protein, Zn/Mn family [Salisediminibacterium beveridgei]|uniref:Manganese ABC transporter substrate binding protein n=1 Tax=Salisediminibacterium beveridgei TaxID=632773 RepID=A0A1D7QU26_9BACI|nr:zinc ABC transporter substrate-binding protein [Salisediminibacterium beveridgei]AOM82520.1 manganese ABC transporter substrate binding protein [Salisediminibacterium beveridgei]
MGKVKLMLAFLSVALLAACGNDQNNEENAASENDAGIFVTTSFSILADVIDGVLGDSGEVDYLVPIGEEPHEYEPVPSDFRKVSDSSVFYTNGLGLEEWLERLIENTGETPVKSLSEGVTEIPLEGESGADPHAWLDPANIEIYAENVLADLSERFPDHKEIFAENAETYIQEINELDEWIKEQVEGIPEENRIIVVSENAFKYYGEAYDFETAGIWEINSGEEGTSGQINAIIDLVRDRDIPSLFVETTVDSRYIETVSEDTGVNIAGEVYTDAVGMDGSGAETYVDMMRHNTEVFVDGLMNQ